MATLSPAPFPENGVRKLSPKETMQRLNALRCTFPKDNRPTCSSQLFVGIFFDGTDNNRQRDYLECPVEKRRHSNIVRLFHTYRDEYENGYFRIYIPGVGTKFPEIGDSGKSWDSMAGSAAAWKGEDRIIWALLQVLNAPHRFACRNAYLIPNDQAKAIVDNTASSATPGAMRHLILNTWQDKLAAALKDRKPGVEQINLSVFGFSRGAAQARTFVNWLLEVCKPEGGGWTLAGIPFRVQFLGIFDTVASVGVANLFDNGVLAGHQGWADNTQDIHPAVEQCVHFVAGHEIRACFPLDSVRINSHYPDNAVEVMYPGSHSDVGGGYAPGELGVSPTPETFMATIPAANMYHEALKAGVPLKAWENLLERFRSDLTPSPETVAAFNAYLHAAGLASGSVEEMGQRHMSLYFSYRFKHRGDFFQHAPYAAASTRDQSYLKRTQDCLIERLSSLTPVADLTKPRSMRQKVALAPDFDPGKSAHLQETMLKAAGMQPSLPDKHTIAVAKRIDVQALTPDIERFFEHYLHDSMAGFSEKLNEYTKNGIGFVKFRTVFKGDD